MVTGTTGAGSGSCFPLPNPSSPRPPFPDFEVLTIPLFAAAVAVDLAVVPDADALAAGTFALPAVPFALSVLGLAVPFTLSALGLAVPFALVVLGRAVRHAY